MSNRNYYCLILCGGVGSRFWPLSTKNCPKQFHDILGTGKTLIQQTFTRVKELIRIKNIFLVTQFDYRDLVLQQIPELEESNLLLEPFMKNTAPSIAYASFKIHEINKEAVVFVTPSDHFILEESCFFKTLSHSFQNAVQEEILITIGIAPTRPDPGYGYIQFYCSDSLNSVKKIKTFIEKPTPEIAQRFLKSGNFLWNSGIFIWQTKTILRAFEIFLPKIFTSFLEIINTFNSPKEVESIEVIFPSLPHISIDYGILEYAQNVYVIEGNFGWVDLGTWSSLYEKTPKDKNGNACIGKKISFYESRDNIVFLQNSKSVIIEGLNDYIIVDTEKALLICKKENEQQLKIYVNDFNMNFGE